jgi:hypothetical protein
LLIVIYPKGIAIKSSPNSKIIHWIVSVNITAFIPPNEVYSSTITPMRIMAYFKFIAEKAAEANFAPDNIYELVNPIYPIVVITAAA